MKKNIKFRRCIMQYTNFIIPKGGNSQNLDDLNSFLRKHKIISVAKEFFQQDGSWSILVEYLEVDDNPRYLQNGKSGKVDYKQILSEEEFAVFSKLRDWRKKVAGEKNIPPYVIFTDKQMAEIITSKTKSKSDLQKINGIGKEKSDQYGTDVLFILNGKKDEDDEIPF